MRIPLLMTLFSSCCFCFPTFSPPGFAQQAASPTQGAPAEGDTASARAGGGRRISLDVVVTDKSGRPVPGLQQQDFTLLDDKQPRTILSFRASGEASAAADSPLQAILLVDAVNTGFQVTARQRQDLGKFLRQDGGQLPIPMSLVLLTDTATEVQPLPTRDGKALADSLASNQTGLRDLGRSGGFYGGVDRLQISLHALERLISREAKLPGRKLLVWLSAGWPLLSGPGVQLTAKDQETLFNTVVELSTTLREARITLYSVDPLGVSDAGSFRTFYYESFLKGVTSANAVQNGNLGLQVLAAQSGGRVLNSSNDIANAITNCLVDAQAFYTLSFDSPPADHPNEYHSLQIKIDKPGLTARTRTGYYAQKQKP
jgi:VWFA-related protein